jgi:O-antigen ligase
MANVGKRSIPIFLTCILAFFSPLGESISILNMNVSKIFPIISIIIILYSMIASKGRIILYSKMLYFFIFFVAIHTFILYSFVIPGELGVSIIEEEIGVSILRFFLFATVSFSLISIFVKIPNALNYFVVWFNIGILFALLNGYQEVNSFSELRISGGFSDPNAFGYIGAFSLFLNIFNVSNIEKKTWTNRISYVSIIVAIFIIISSGSRGAILGSVIGVFYLFAREKRLSKKMKFIIWGSCALIILITLLPEEIKSTILKRVSLERAIEDRGARRLDIWQAYISQWSNYLFWGVGYDRSPTVLSNTLIYNTHILPHNTYLKILVEFGIIAFINYAMVLVNIWRKIGSFIKSHFNEMRYRSLNALLIAFVVISFFLDVLTQRATWLIIAVLISSTIKDSYSLGKRVN